MKNEKGSMIILKDDSYFKNFGIDKCLRKTYNYKEARTYQNLDISTLIEDYHKLEAINQEPTIIAYVMVNGVFKVLDKNRLPS